MLQNKLVYFLFHFTVFKILNANQIVNNRYRIQQQIGQGTFSIVYKAYDNKLNQYVCIKFFKNSGPKYIRAGQHEQQICNSILGLNSSQQIISSFQYGNNLCLVFELLGPSLKDILTFNQGIHFPQSISLQLIYYLLISLKDLKSKQIIHGDIKPANVLTLGDPVRIQYNNQSIVLPQILNLKLCDFGNAFYQYEQKQDIIQTQSYRAPEVLLQDDYSYPIDIFSVGCIFFEFLTGIKLFQCRSTLCQILLLQKYIQIDSEYIQQLYLKQSKKMQINQLLQQYNRIENKFIYRKGQLIEQEEQLIKQACPIQEILQAQNINQQIIDLIYKMLESNPYKRITVEQALCSQVFQDKQFNVQ